MCWGVSGTYSRLFAGFGYWLAVYYIYILFVGLFGLVIWLLVCYLWVDRVIVRVGVRSKLGVDGSKEMDG